MSALDAAFNENKVHRRLAAMLPAGRELVAHVDRYSLFEADGIVTQVLNTTARHAGDRDVRTYVSIDPADAAIWDPNEPTRLPEAVRAAAEAARISDFGAVWVRGRDVHPNCRHNDVVAAIVLIGQTIFVRATTSAVKRAIRRADGPDENTYTILLAALARHYRLRQFRFDEDTSRAARDDLSSGIFVDVCIERGTKLQFGVGQVWDPQDPLQRQMLQQLLGFGAVDDAARRRRLAGKRLQKLINGGAPRSELQMPHGYRHARDGAGERVRIDGKGFIPEADWSFVPKLQELVRRHAEGASYVELGQLMAELDIERRGQKQRTIASLRELVEIGDHSTLAEAAKSFFVNKSASPSQELEKYLQKMRLWRSGVFCTQINNDIRGRGMKVAGMTPTYRDEQDEFGFFDVRVQWPWPIDPATGEPLVAWGVAEELEKCEARLLKELREPRPTGGAAHNRAAKRAVAPSEWTSGSSVFSVQPRQYNSGRHACVIFANTIEARGDRRGWSVERAHAATYARATFPLTDLCASLANAIESRVLELLDPKSIAAVELPRQPAARDCHRLRKEQRSLELRGRLEANRQEEEAKRADADGQELLAGRRLANGDEDGANRAEKRARELLEEADALVAARVDLEAKLRDAEAELAEPAPIDTVEAELNVAAYLVAGLRRASEHNGIGPASLAEVIASHVTDWVMTVDEEGVRWSARLSLPLVDGTQATVPVSGVIDNVRSAAGGRSATSGTVLAEQVLVEGRSLDDLAATSGVATSRRALVMKHLMPWLKEHGITSRGACCALVDHPVPAVRQLVFAHLTDTTIPPNVAAWPEALRDLVVETYTDHRLRWGDAACPDDARAIQRIVNAVVAAGPHGIAIDALAVAAGWSYTAVRELAQPYGRAAGFTRPRFVELHPIFSTGVRALMCTHCSRRDRQAADRVVLLPEVAASGFGVLCTCGRPPVPRSAPEYRRWHRVAFPPAFTEVLFTRLARSSLRDEPQTGVAPDYPPLVVARRAP